MSEFITADRLCGRGKAQASPVIELGDLATLPIQINCAVREAEHHAGMAVHVALKAGALLIQAKTMVPHGHWEDWLADNCTVALRTAQAYMRLASKLPALPAENATAVALLPLREAVQAIGTSPTAPTRGKGTVRLPTRTDRERAEVALKASAAAMRRAARDVGFGQIKRIKIEQVRSRLQAAIGELDKLLAGAEVQP